MDLGTTQAKSGSISFPCQWRAVHGQEDAEIERQQALLVAAAQAAPAPRELLPRDYARPGTAEHELVTGLSNDLKINTV